MRLKRAPFLVLMGSILWIGLSLLVGARTLDDPVARWFFVAMGALMGGVSLLGLALESWWAVQGRRALRRDVIQQVKGETGK